MDSSKLYAIIGSLTTLIGLISMSFIKYHVKTMNDKLDTITSTLKEVNNRLTTCRTHCDLTSSKLYGKIADTRVEFAKRRGC